MPHVATRAHDAAMQVIRRLRHEKSENGFPCVSYGVAKAKRSPPKRTRSARAYAAFDHCNDGAREVLDLAHWSPERIIPPSGYLAGGD
jgi:hypothetical protein